MSSALVGRPTLTRRLERAALRSRPMAVRTWDGSGCPALQADPVEMARPRACSMSRSASIPGMEPLLEGWPDSHVACAGDIGAGHHAPAVVGQCVVRPC